MTETQITAATTTTTTACNHKQPHPWIESASGVGDCATHLQPLCLHLTIMHGMQRRDACGTRGASSVTARFTRLVTATITITVTVTVTVTITIRVAPGQGDYVRQG
mgnify:CR=1 FL=1